MVQERIQCVISQLFQHRIIRCGGAVDDDMANIIAGQLLYLDAVDPTKVRSCFDFYVLWNFGISRFGFKLRSWSLELVPNFSSYLAKESAFLCHLP